MKKGVIIFLILISLISSSYAVTYEIAGYATIYKSDSSVNTGTKACKSNFQSDAICSKVQKLVGGVWQNLTLSCGAVPPDSSSYRAECKTPVVCTSHVYFKCYNGDVYWYNSCNVREDKKEDCGTGTCSNNQCVCANECFTSGVTRCKPGANNIIQTCGNYDADSCLEWGGDSYCQAGKECTTGVGGNAYCVVIGTFCGNFIVDSGEECDQNIEQQTACTSIAPNLYSGGYATCNLNCKWNLANCIYKCTDECTTGEKECVTSTSFKTCGNYDADSCLEWSSAVSCSGGQVCSNGICVTPLKANGEVCSANSECLSGNCIGPNWHCAAADKECYFFSPASAVDIGQPADGQNVCWSKCSPGSCTEAINYPKCRTHKPYCTTIGYLQCREVGTSGLWASTSCPETTPSCDSVTGVCKCTTTSCDSGYYCDPSGCKLNTCTPNSYSGCYSDTARNKCNSIGDGWIAENCASGYGCEGGICVQACSTLHSGAFCTNSPSGSYTSYTDSYCAGSSICIKCNSGYVKVGSAGSEYCILGCSSSNCGGCTSSSSCNTYDLSKGSDCWWDGSHCCLDGYYWSGSSCTKATPCSPQFGINPLQGVGSGQACCYAEKYGIYGNYWTTIQEF